MLIIEKIKQSKSSRKIISASVSVIQDGKQTFTTDCKNDIYKKLPPVGKHKGRSYYLQVFVNGELLPIDQTYMRKLARRLPPEFDVKVVNTYVKGKPKNLKTK